MKNYLFLLMLIMVTNAAIAQHCSHASCHATHVFVYAGYNAKSISTVKHKGYLVLVSGDTLRGYITLDENSFQSQLSYKKETASEYNIKIRYADIIYVRLYDADTSFMETKYTEFFRLDSHNNLWRLLTYGSVKFYDKLPYTNEAAGTIGDDIKKENDNKVVNVSSFWSWNTKHDLVNEVNEMYGKKFRYKDFPDASSVVKWIAKK